MALAPSAILEFNERVRLDSNRFKQATDANLDAYIAKRWPEPEWIYPPYRHQKVSLALCMKHPTYGIFLEMGLGKTKVMLDAFMYRRYTGEATRMLVLVPSITNLLEWKDQVKTHSPGLTCSAITGKGAVERMEQLTVGDVTVCTYVGWLRLISPGNGKIKISKLGAHAAEVEQMFDFIVFDESSLLKRATSTFFKAARRLLRTAPFGYCLTGTATGKNQENVWSQMFLADQGHSLGKTLGLFRASFCDEKKSNWHAGSEYKFRPEEEPRLHQYIRHASVAYTTSEVREGMPDVIGGISSEKLLIRAYDFTRDQWKDYEALVSQLKSADGVFEEVNSIYLRMRQLTSGYVSYTDANGTKHHYEIPKHPKLEGLVELLGEFPADDGVVIFCHYKMTCDIVSKALKAAKIKNVVINSQTTPKVRETRLGQFKDGTVKVLIGTKAIAYGLNLQKCANRTVFYESFDAPDDRYQAEKRTPRPGQTKVCTIYDLCMAGSIDFRILASVREGKRVLDSLIRGIH